MSKPSYDHDTLKALLHKQESFRKKPTEEEAPKKKKCRCKDWKLTDFILLALASFGAAVIGVKAGKLILHLFQKIPEITLPNSAQ